MSNRTPRVRSLSSIEGILRELRSTYRATRSGSLPSAELTRLWYALSLMARITETSILETRLADAERQLSALLARLPNHDK